MLLHVVADQEDRISALRTLLETPYHVTSSLLRKENNVPKGCDAAIVSADLKNADSIAALKEVSAKLKGAKRKIYILDQKARLQAAQAYEILCGMNGKLEAPLVKAFREVALNS